MVRVKIKKLNEDAKIPKYAKPGDAGMDLTAIDAVHDNDFVTYHTGLAMEIPQGHLGFLFPRSSVYKTGQKLTNSVGVIDSGYRGEIMLKFSKSHSNKEYNIGDRVGQIIIMPYPLVTFYESADLSQTERGTGGYGSTGV
jgi:dUTP pyrophosphatase